MAQRTMASRRNSFDVLASPSSIDNELPTAARQRNRTLSKKRKKGKASDEAGSAAVVTVSDDFVEAETVSCATNVTVNGDQNATASSVESSCVINEREPLLEKEVSRSKVMNDRRRCVLRGASKRRSPFRYFLELIQGGNALQSTISVGSEKQKLGVHNTMFHVPLKCEQLISTGFIVCLDSFLSLLIIMPARIIYVLWRILTTRQFQRPDAAAISDFGCFIVLAFGVTTMHLTDVSPVYHIIRGQGTLKLYVVYNVLEIFDKMLQSFSEDVLQVLFSSAEGLATCSSDSLSSELIKFILDQTITIIAFTIHGFVLLAQAITLSTSMLSNNNNLFALLVSNNFPEIKVNAFKKISRENLQSLVYYDAIQRFHITAFMLFAFAQNILETKGPWLADFVSNVAMVCMCEVLVDIIKYSYFVKYNEMEPSTYSEYLEDLCKQILSIPSEGPRRDLSFIPIAPAFVVIKAFAPLFPAVLPYGSAHWRWLWNIVWSGLIFAILAICKVFISMTLTCFASWYIGRCEGEKKKISFPT